MEDANQFKFPSILMNKIDSKEFEFPVGTLFSYEPIAAYRAITRKDGESPDITRTDFMSYAELGKKGRSIDINDPHYYGVSLYKDKKLLENALKFPRPNWKVAEGMVYFEGGPIDVNEKTEHICWWLYDNIEIKGFSICLE